MQKLLFLVFMLFFISPHSHAAVNCSSGRITLGYDNTTTNYNTYDSTQNGPVATLVANVSQNFSCGGDYIETTTMNRKSYLVLPITSGGTCSNGVLTTTIPGVVWRLNGFTCLGNGLKTTKELNGGDTWSGTVGKLILTLTDEYWRQNNSTRTFTLPAPSQGNVKGTNVNVVVTANPATLTHKVMHLGSCSMATTPVNLDFGTISPIEINKGALYQSVTVTWNCVNKALAVNGFNLRFDPENVVNANQATFSATATDGKKLNFQLVQYNQGKETPPQLNKSIQVYAPVTNDVYNTLSLRIKVLPASTYPTGKVSTYLTITATYM